MEFRKKIASEASEKVEKFIEVQELMNVFPRVSPDILGKVRPIFPGFVHISPESVFPNGGEIINFK